MISARYGRMTPALLLLTAVQVLGQLMRSQFRNLSFSFPLTR
jgi:hypothetical protein